MFIAETLKKIAEMVAVMQMSSHVHKAINNTNKTSNILKASSFLLDLHLEHKYTENIFFKNCIQTMRPLSS